MKNLENKLIIFFCNKQSAYRQPGNSLSSRQSSMELLYWKVTGDTIYVRNAVRMLNWTHEGWKWQTLDAGGIFTVTHTTGNSISISK